MTLAPADIHRLRENAARRPRRIRELLVMIELAGGPLNGQWPPRGGIGAG